MCCNYDNFLTEADVAKTETKKTDQEVLKFPLFILQNSSTILIIQNITILNLPRHMWELVIFSMKNFEQGHDQTI